VPYIVRIHSVYPKTETEREPTSATSYRFLSRQLTTTKNKVLPFWAYNVQSYCSQNSITHRYLEIDIHYLFEHEIHSNKPVEYLKVKMTGVRSQLFISSFMSLTHLAKNSTKGSQLRWLESQASYLSHTLWSQVKEKIPGLES